MNYLLAFLIGGLLCIPAQILIDKTNLTNARILTGYVVIGVILSAFNVYKPLVDFASAGATVPLTGFGHALAEGVRESIESNGALGIVTGGIKGTAAGITAAVVLSVIWALFFKSKQK